MHDAQPTTEDERLLEAEDDFGEFSTPAVELKAVAFASEDEAIDAKLLQDEDEETLDELDGREGFLSKEQLIWTAEKERRLVSKLDRLIMPLLILAFFALQLDRGR